MKSNPSKRHRERLNSELDHLASLLPFDQSVISKLDKLSILRLAVSYLRMKCYFQSFQSERALTENRHPSHLYHFPYDLNCSEGDAHLQALNGFVFIVSCDGEVFSASRTVEYYLGFHQSDILHQSVLELIHSEDREEFKRQLSWSALLPADKRNMSFTDVMKIENCHYLQRCFTVRFRCLLDNTSGFITLEISGRLQFLFGQSKSNHLALTNGNSNNNNKGQSDYDESNLPPLGLFAVCSPFGHLPNLDAAQRDLTFKTKHNLDMSFQLMDVRAKVTLGYTDKEVIRLRAYNLIHQDDLNYLAKGHEEIFKNGTIGLLVHRWRNKSQKWVWLQSSLKIIFKAGKQHAIMATHRQLTQDEGRELYTRRNAEYKLPFPLLEPETLLEEDEEEIQRSFKTSNNNVSIGTHSSGTKRPRSQLKDYLQASRKRKAPYREVVQVLPPSCYTAAAAANFHATYGPLAAAASLMTGGDTNGAGAQQTPHIYATHHSAGANPHLINYMNPYHHHHHQHHHTTSSTFIPPTSLDLAAVVTGNCYSRGTPPGTGGMFEPPPPPSQLYTPAHHHLYSTYPNNLSSSSSSSTTPPPVSSTSSSSTSNNNNSVASMLIANAGACYYGTNNNNNTNNYDVLSSYYPPTVNHHSIMDMETIGRVPKLLSPYLCGNTIGGAGAGVNMSNITTDTVTSAPPQPDNNNNNLLQLDHLQQTAAAANQEMVDMETAAAAASLLVADNKSANLIGQNVRRHQLYNSSHLTSYEQQQQQQQQQHHQLLLNNFNKDFLAKTAVHKSDFYRCGDSESIAVPVVQSLWSHNT